MDSEADIRSIDNCITVLQEGLHQPGTPAIVLKLAASWQKLKALLCPPSPVVVQLPQGEEGLVTVSVDEGAVVAVSNATEMNERAETQVVAVDSNSESRRQEVLESGIQSSESKGQEISSESLEVQSSGLLLFLTKG